MADLLYSMKAREFCSHSEDWHKDGCLCCQAVDEALEEFATYAAKEIAPSRVKSNPKWLLKGFLDG